MITNPELYIFLSVFILITYRLKYILAIYFKFIVDDPYGASIDSYYMKYGI